MSLKKFEKNLKEIPLQMTIKIQQCRWGRGGGAELVPQYVFQRLVREKGSHIPEFQYFHTFVESLDMTFEVAGSENRRLVTSYDCH